MNKSYGTLVMQNLLLIDRKSITITIAMNGIKAQT